VGSWDKQLLRAYDIVVSGMTDDHGVFVSTDDGASWTQFNDGFSIAPPYVVAFSVHAGFMFGATELRGIWRRKL
jgi:hypothetical protein